MLNENSVTYIAGRALQVELVNIRQDITELTQRRIRVQTYSPSTPTTIFDRRLARLQEQLDRITTDPAFIAISAHDAEVAANRE
jgi:hypothetical protein